MKCFEKENLISFRGYLWLMMLKKMSFCTTLSMSKEWKEEKNVVEMRENVEQAGDHWRPSLNGEYDRLRWFVVGYDSC